MNTLDQFNKHLLHPWGDLPGLGEDETTPVIVRGKGAYIYDEHGQRLLDGPAGMWCMQTGYGRQEIADAVSAQIMQLGYATAVTVMGFLPTSPDVLRPDSTSSSRLMLASEVVVHEVQADGSSQVLAKQ